MNKKKNKKLDQWICPKPLPAVPPQKYPMALTNKQLALLIKQGIIGKIDEEK